MALCPSEPEIAGAMHFAAGALMHESPEAQVADAGVRLESLQGRE